jgi:hypothetical protein
MPSKAAVAVASGNEGWRERAGALNRTLWRYFNELEGMWWDRRLGITTRGWDWSYSTLEHCYCGPSPYRLIFRILRFLKPAASDELVDLGCGLGRVVCCASLYGAGKSVGVEDVDTFAGLARENAMRMLRRDTITIVSGRAERYDCSRVSLIYMCNPFGAETMEQVLSKLKASLVFNPRQVRIAYVNPVHRQVLAGKPWLEQYDSWTDRQQWSFIPPVTFWRTGYTFHQ